MKTTLTIQNLKCGGCIHTINTKLSAIKGINSVEICIDNSSIVFDYATNETLAEVKNTLKSIGYPIVGDVNSVLSKARSFVSCASGKLSKK